ncbi:hypothetical protein Pcinc_037180, partial [Petrolisthes cinctipes]
FVVWGRLSCSRSFNTVGGLLDYLQLLLHSTPPYHHFTAPLHTAEDETCVTLITHLSEEHAGNWSTMEWLM